MSQIHEPLDLSKLVENYKDQNNKADNGKIQMYLLYEDMSVALEAIAAVLSYGAEKYEARGWKKVGRERYVDALFRHKTAMDRGERYDEESGLPHSAHMACNMMFLLEFDLAENFQRSDWTRWNKPPQDHKS